MIEIVQCDSDCVMCHCWEKYHVKNLNLILLFVFSPIWPRLTRPNFDRCYVGQILTMADLVEFRTRSTCDRVWLSRISVRIDCQISNDANFVELQPLSNWQSFSWADLAKFWLEPIQSNFSRANSIEFLLVPNRPNFDEGRLVEFWWANSA